MSRRKPMTRVRPQVMCKKHPAIPAVQGKHLCASCLEYDRFGKTMAAAAAAPTKK